MEDFGSLFTPFWWFSVVIVGLLLSVAGTYLVRLFDKQLAKISSARERRATERAEAERQMIQDLRSRFAEQHALGITIVYGMVAVLCFLVITFGASLLALVTPMALDSHLAVSQPYRTFIIVSLIALGLAVAVFAVIITITVRWLGLLLAAQEESEDQDKADN
jgi:hypothetical protein